ncbi:O-antigen ligase family protein [Spiribacter halobius]|nr:O-antigen ligase family protein [Spiribacter halobius]UEX78244.1 O-antigen ligase family protein [Spiribacter halobius]
MPTREMPWVSLPSAIQHRNYRMKTHHAPTNWEGTAPAADAGLGRIHRGADGIGYVGLLGFALFAWLGTAGANAALLLMLVATVIHGITGEVRQLIRSPLAAWAAVWLAYVAFWAMQGPVAGQQAAGFYDAAAGYAYLALVVVPAWWLARFASTRHWLRVALLALVGFVLGRLVEVDWADPLRFFRQRDGLGLPAIALGQYAAAALLGLLLMPPDMAAQRVDEPNRWIRAALWTLLLVTVAFLLLASRSRGAWLAFLVVLIPALWFRYRARPNPAGHAAAHWPLAAAVAGGAGLLALAVWYTDAADMVQNRLQAESQTYQAVIEGRWSDVGDGSIGTRIQMYRLGMERFAEAPLVGWGPGMGKWMLDRSGSEHLAKFQDLHSLLIQLPAELGMIGVVLFVVPLALAIAGFARERLPVSKPMLILIISGLALHLLCAATNFRVFNVDWRFYWFLFAGFGLALAIAPAGAGTREDCR